MSKLEYPVKTTDLYPKSLATSSHGPCGIHVTQAVVKYSELSVPTECNIGSKTLLLERGKLTLKFTCTAGTSTCPADTSTCPTGTSTCPASTSTCPASPSTCPASPSTCPAGTSTCIYLVLLAPLPVFAEFTCNLQWGKWLCCMMVNALDHSAGGAGPVLITLLQGCPTFSLSHQHVIEASKHDRQNSFSTV